MLAIVKIEGGIIKEWMTATDINDAIQKAKSNDRPDIAQALEGVSCPPEGKTITLGTGHQLLIDQYVSKNNIC